jgi:YD repeat-containing protein
MGACGGLVLRPPTLIVPGALGRVTSFTNSEGHVYRLAYDGQSRIIAATNGANEQVFRNFYDLGGNLTNRVDGAGRNTRNLYDVLNRCTNTVYADNSVDSFSFDSIGNLLTAKNAATTNNALRGDRVGAEVQAIERSLRRTACVERSTAPRRGRGTRGSRSRNAPCTLDP